MPYPIKTDFEYITSVPASWLRDVAERLNGMKAADGISIDKDGTFRLGDDQYSFRYIWGCQPVFADGELVGLKFTRQRALCALPDSPAVVIVVEGCSSAPAT